ncbi:MAG: GGDEF domain-containing protein [Peptostreptococcaceae bacterium]|nr:GGDEF domain-containing protein [Peptostreptococcaceae bacterium]
MRNKHIKKSRTSIIIVFVLIVSLILTNLYTFNYIDEINGDARVVNYTGIIRGGTQRLVKLEANGIRKDSIVLEIENILREIKYDHKRRKGIYHQDAEYHHKINQLNDVWFEIQKEISKVREGEPPKELIRLSEEHYKLANEAVFLAENYSEVKVIRVTNIRRAMLLGSSLMLLLYISQVLGMFKLEKNIEELGKKASIDAQTDLPNRSECDRMLENFSGRRLPKDLMALAIDINGLKETNDNYGHNVGDILIVSFAKILEETARSFGFVGRNGGDEFIGIFENCTEEDMQKFLKELNERIDSFNAQGGVVQISYASGHASSNEDFVNIYDLIKKADKRMYEKKRAMYFQKEDR